MPNLSSLFGVFPRRFTSAGEVLTVDYCSRTKGFCFSNCFLDIFWGRQGLDVGGQSCDGRIPTFVHPHWENPALKLHGLQMLLSEAEANFLGLTEMPGWTADKLVNCKVRLPRQQQDLVLVEEKRWVH